MHYLVFHFVVHIIVNRCELDLSRKLHMEVETGGYSLFSVSPSP